MFRIALALGAACQASRVQVHEVFEADSHAKFGASCDDLQHRFHDRVILIQASLEGIDEQTHLSAGGRVRLAMRMQGIVRTLRRARECSWVVENDSEDIDAMRGVVQQLLAGNQCAEAARLEMQRGSSDENAESLRNAIGILMSDDCEVPDMPEGNTDASAEEQMQEAEDELNDRIDELNSDGEGSAFMEVEKSQTIRSFLRGVGVVFLMIFLLLGCVTAATAIAFVLSYIFALLALSIFGGDPITFQLTVYVYGTLAGGALSILPCAYQTVSALLVAPQQ